jgi:Spy/CpxP family protein refolding chaperone
MKIAWIQILLSLILGISIGVFFEKNRDCNCPCSSSKPHCMKDKKMFKEKMLNHFSKELDLTLEQRVKVKAIFAEKKKEMDKLRGDLRPRFEALRKSTHEEIKAILNKDQQIKLDKMEVKFDSMRKKWKSMFEGPEP